MDPLSISASIVAILGATTTVVRGLDKLQALRHAPTELVCLQNEVADLQVVVTNVNKSVESLRGLGSQIPQDALQSLPNMIERAAKTIHDLNGFISADLLKVNGKISHRAWLGKDKKLAAFRSSIKECKENLNVVLLSSTSRIIPHMLLNIQEVVIIDRDRATRSIEALKQMAERFAAHPAFLQNVIESNVVDAAEDDASSAPLTSLISPLHGHSPGPDNTYLRIKTTVKTRSCDKYCNCQCHVQSHIATPRWLQGLVGTLFYSYAGTPALNSAKCNLSPRCGQSRATSTQFCYYFPTWMVRKALIFTSTWRDVTGSGATWSIRVPRVFGINHNAVTSIVAGNLPNLQRIISKRDISPFDIDKEGRSLLWWAEIFWQWEIFAYLVTIGSDIHLADNNGISVVDMVWFKRFQNSDATYNAHVPQFDEDYSLQLSPIHRLVLGFVDGSLEQQLEIDCSQIESVDWQGRTPLLWVATRGDATNLRMLLDHGANIHAKDSEGATALHLAVVYGHHECIKLLLDDGADVHNFELMGLTPLHCAASSTSPERTTIIGTLCCHGANIEARTPDGWTPLYLAADSDNSAAISSLVEWGADVNDINIEGWSVIGRTIVRNHVKTMVTLYHLGAALNWDRARVAGNVLGIAASCASIRTMEALAAMDPGKRIVYDPYLLYKWFDNRADHYVGPEEDPDELLAAFENLLASIGTPNPDMKYSDEDYPSEEEYMNGSEKDWETVSDSGSDEDVESDRESTAENFQDAVEVQEATGLMAGAVLSDSVPNQERSNEATGSGN